MLASLGSTPCGLADEPAKRPVDSTADGAVTKSLLRVDEHGENLLRPAAWQALDQGFRREGNAFGCDNGTSGSARRGLFQRVELNQREPLPIVASAWSKAEGVSGSIDSDYSVYLDLVYGDGTELWGQAAGFRTGTHDWQREEVVLFPEKPVKTVAFYLLFRGHAGKAWFRDAELRPMNAPEGAVMFDGVPVVPRGPAAEGFQVRDVAAGSDFVRIDKETLGLQLEVSQQRQAGATFLDVTLRDTTGKDRAVTLLYTIPVAPQGVRWLDDPRRSRAVEGGREYVRATRSAPGPTAGCRCIRWGLLPVRATVRRGGWPWGSTWLIRPSTASATTPAPASSTSPTTSA